MYLLTLVVAALPITDVPPPAYVEFDFGPVPLKSKEKIQITFQVFTADCDTFLDKVGFYELNERSDLTHDLPSRMTEYGGLKAELVADDTKVRVYGRVDKDGNVYCPAVRGEVWTQNLPLAEVPRVKNPPPPPVRFDLRPVPLSPGHRVTLSCEVVPDDRAGGPVRVEVSYEKAARTADLAKELAERFTKAGLSASADGDAVLVRGWEGKDKKVRPAAVGTTSSKQLRTEELPTVWGLPRPAPCVEFDFAPAAAAAGREAKVGLEVSPFVDGKPFLTEKSFDKLPSPGDLAGLAESRLVMAGFKLERDGTKVRVFGWSDGKMRFHPAETGKVVSAELKQAERPTIKTPPTGER